MESTGAAAIATCIPMEKGCMWVSIMSDDDSTMRSWTKNKKNGGKLTDSIPQPEEYLCDPTHHSHVFGTHVYKLMSKPQKESKLTRSMLPS